MIKYYCFSFKNDKIANEFIPFAIALGATNLRLDSSAWNKSPPILILDIDEAKLPELLKHENILHCIPQGWATWKANIGS